VDSKHLGPAACASRQQQELAQLVQQEDACDWHLGDPSACSLQLVGGLDISFTPEPANGPSRCGLGGRGPGRPCRQRLCCSGGCCFHGLQASQKSRSWYAHAPTSAAVHLPIPHVRIWSSLELLCLAQGCRPPAPRGALRRHEPSPTLPHSGPALAAVMLPWRHWWCCVSQAWS
jgi:hypothetical protein